MVKSKVASPYVPYSKELGEFLRQHRVKVDLSQAECSKALGYETPQVISNWERGVQSPPFSKLLEICKLFKMSSSEMLEKLLDVQREIYKDSIQLEQSIRVKKPALSRRRAS